MKENKKQIKERSMSETLMRDIKALPVLKISIETLKSYNSGVFSQKAGVDVKKVENK